MGHLFTLPAARAGKQPFRIDSRRVYQAFKNVHRAVELRAARSLTRDWFKLASAYIGLPVRRPFTIRLRTGTFTFETLADVRTFWSVFFAGTYIVLPDDKVIVDAGANIGTFTLFALLNAPMAHVVAIEPASDCCAHLRSLVLEHGFAHRCEIHQTALGDDFKSSSLDMRCQSQFREVGKGATRIPVVPLDHLVGGRSIDLLKLDIEGSEYEVILSKPECLERVQRIALEYHPNQDGASLLDVLGARGLTSTFFRDDGNGYGIAHFVRSDKQGGSLKSRRQHA